MNRCQKHYISCEMLRPANNRKTKNWPFRLHTPFRAVSIGLEPMALAVWPQIRLLTAARAPSRRLAWDITADRKAIARGGTVPPPPATRARTWSLPHRPGHPPRSPPTPPPTNPPTSHAQPFIPHLHALPTPFRPSPHPWCPSPPRNGARHGPVCPPHLQERRRLRPRRL